MHIGNIRNCLGSINAQNIGLVAWAALMLPATTFLRNAVEVQSKWRAWGHPFRWGGHLQAVERQRTSAINVALTTCGEGRRWQADRSKRFRGLFYIRYVADGVVGIIGGSFGCAPAAQQAIVGIIPVNENHRSRLVRLVRDTPKRIISPHRGVVFGIGQRK